MGRSWWREGTDHFLKVFSIFSRVPTFFLPTYSKQATAKKQKLYAHAMSTLNQYLVQLFGWLNCFSPCAGSQKVSLGTWLFSCSLWESHEHRRVFCLQFFHWTTENEPSPDSFKQNCTFLHKDAGVPWRGQQNHVCPRNSRHWYECGFCFFSTQILKRLHCCQGRNPHWRPGVYEVEMDLKVMLKICGNK